MAPQDTPPDMQEVVKALINELLGRFSSLLPILQAIGWAVVAYFVILIIIALIKARRAKKHIKLLEEITFTLHEIKDRLPEKKSDKKEKKSEKEK